MSDNDVLALEEWAKGNFSVGGALFSADIVFEAFPERSAILGLENVVAYFRDFLAQWSEYRIEAEEFIAEGDLIVVTERQYAKGEWSGIETVQTFYAVWTFRDGRVARVRWEDDRNTTLTSLGLAE
ncbi:MAG: nuclear transport factor 2 family protein [Thermoleophilaceae bacterium]|nr:nuclear transport factor 2 family protein [Thermoleophilaceae bacterium]